ncbi:VRR-NUC domain-containing protein [Dyadobacter sp. CY327]|uniref:VRR-NUC domain-containing protein n=1 Tax=Dyadobacter sp. CY327 TaxID=2907301 RepID=UPI001F17BD1E|nr:VRR-NUC domain-containing protein [Dyadobacter sp. CY327]MCE7073679.1 VRR-NUC domain-containing protein [Dyadobacter sp. CY327]
MESIRWLESDIQSFIVLKLRDLLQDEPGSYIFWGDMGGMKTTVRTASKAKALGLEQGIPDLFLMFPGHRLVCIELKRKGGVVSGEQKKKHAAMQEMGFPVYVVKAKTPADGWSQVLTILQRYGI